MQCALSPYPQPFPTQVSAGLRWLEQAVGTLPLTDTPISDADGAARCTARTVRHGTG